MVYYSVTRKVGHTQTLKEGLPYDDCGCIIIVGNGCDKLLYSEYRSNIILTLDDVYSGKMRGLRLPVVFDNSAIVQMLSIALNQLHTLNDILQKLETLKPLLERKNGEDNLTDQYF